MSAALIPYCTLRMSTPCTSCRGVLGSLTLPHTVDKCPLSKLRYCGICAIYGHNEHNCPDQDAMKHREPLYLEQLIPSSLIADYNIQSQTMITTKPPLRVPQKPIMEVPETEEALRAALVAAGVKPMICQEKGKKEKKEIIENKKRLQKVADIYGRKLVFVKPSH